MGCGLALIIGIVFIIVFYVAQNSVFSGNGETIFESALTLLASYLITLLGFAMLKIRGYEAKWESKLQRQAAAQAAAQTDPTVSVCSRAHVQHSMHFVCAQHCDMVCKHPGCISCCRALVRSCILHMLCIAALGSSDFHFWCAMSCWSAACAKHPNSCKAPTLCLQS